MPGHIVAKLLASLQRILHMQHRAQFVANYLDYYMFQRHSRAVSEKEEEEKEEKEVGGGARREVNI